MRGFPAVTTLDSSGRRVRTIVRRARPGASGFGAVQIVTLRTGQRAWFIVSWADGTGYAHASCPTSAQLRLTPPGAGRGVVLRGPHGRITPYGGAAGHLQCGAVTVGPVHPYTPGSY